MKVQLNTDNNIDSADIAPLGIETRLRQALAVFEPRITRAEVHLRDDSAGRATGDDKRCMIEVRPAGSHPLAVTCHAATIEEAVDGALDKIHTLLGSHFDRLNDQVPGSDSIRRMHPGA